MLKRLETYPCATGRSPIFVVICNLCPFTSKRAEQNKSGWAFQRDRSPIGHPISSLMAWIEILKENYPRIHFPFPEMDKDVKRLQLIADRFSKIGSLPEPALKSERSDRPRHRLHGQTNVLRKWRWLNNCLQVTSSWRSMRSCLSGLSRTFARMLSMPWEEKVRLPLTWQKTNESHHRRFWYRQRAFAKNIGNVFRPGFTTKSAVGAGTFTRQEDCGRISSWTNFEKVPIMAQPSELNFKPFPFRGNLGNGRRHSEESGAEHRNVIHWKPYPKPIAKIIKIFSNLFSIYKNISNFATQNV